MGNQALELVPNTSRRKPACLPQPLLSALDAGKKNLVVDGEFNGVCEDRNWIPQDITAEQCERLRSKYVPEVEHELSPADEDWINGRVATLLVHYYVPNVPHELQVMALEDWIRILSPFPQWAIEAAVDEWLNRPGRQKPMPGDIAAGCRWRVAEPALNLKLLRKMVEHHERQLPAGRRA